MKRILIAFDDTDEPGKGRGTGELLEEFVESCCGEGALKEEPFFISRHQLLIHPDVPYTSHNSSMVCRLKVADVGELINKAAAWLKKEQAPGSDPGLAVVCPDQLSTEKEGQLVAYGLRAKEKLIRQSDALETAKQCGVHLSAHGGTGDGIIGALAGIGLRLEGNDGRVKGKHELECSGGLTTVDNLIEAGAGDRCCLMVDGQLAAEDLDPAAIVQVDGPLKAVVRCGERWLPLIPLTGGRYRTVNRKALKSF